jgi:hypothetical protein
MAKGQGKGGSDEAAIRSMKLFVIVLNVVTALAGLSLIVFGIYALYRSELVLYSKSIPVTMIISGSLVFLISFVGCFGAEMEHRTTLMTYFGAFLLIVLAQVIVTIYAFSNTDKIDDTLDNAWQRAYEHRPKAIRTIEDEFSCCGYRNIYDRAVPNNCSQSPSYGYETSCYTQLMEAYKNNQTTIGVVGGLLGFLQIVALLSTLALIHHLPSDSQRDRLERGEYERIVAKARRTGANEYGSTSRG